MARKRRKPRQLGHITEDMSRQIEIKMHLQAGTVAKAAARGDKAAAKAGKQRLEGMKSLAAELGVKCLCTKMIPTGQQWCFCTDSFTAAKEKTAAMRKRQRTWERS